MEPPQIIQEYSSLEKNLSSTSKNSRSTFRKISDTYFDIKSFEKSGKLYGAFGIKWFRKYCPNGGSKFSISGSFVKGRKKEDLESFVKSTKILEGFHAGFLPFYIFPTVTNLLNENYIGAGVWTVLNFGVNIYPVMAQRYNRNKINKMIDILEKREIRNNSKLS